MSRDVTLLRFALTNSDSGSISGTVFIRSYQSIILTSTCFIWTPGADQYCCFKLENIVIGMNLIREAVAL